MDNGTLYIGHMRYSSWSMRGWLAVKRSGLKVAVKKLKFTRPGPTKAIQDVSPNGMVPYLEHYSARIWESLAICEYCADIDKSMWPEDRIARAHARSISAEMHAGFRELRMAMWMNLGADFAGKGRTPGALADIARMEKLWADTRSLYGASGPYLFGYEFNAADAMFAPVVARFLTWKPELTTATLDYCHAIRHHPLVDEWYQGAAAEPEDWLIEQYENA